MTTKYPSQVDTSLTLPTLVDTVSGVNANSINIIRDTAIAIEQELGIKPSGLYTTVRARLDYLESNVVTSLSGDVTGTPYINTVVALYGRPLSTTPPTSGYSLVWDGYHWTPQAPAANITFAGDLSGSTLTQTVVALQGNAVLSGALGSTQDGYVLTWVNSTGKWTPKQIVSSGSITFGGDLSGGSSSQTVVALQGNAVLSGALGATQDGYVLTWTNSISKWQAKPSVGSSSVVLAGDVTGNSGSNTVVSLTGSAGVVTIPSGTTLKQLDSTGYFASTGTIRTSPTFSIVGRNTTNAADITLLQWDGSNNINIGSANGVGSLGLLGNQITAYTSGGVYIDAQSLSLRGPSHLGGLVFDSSVANNIKQTIDAGYTFTLSQTINATGAGLGMNFTGQAAKASSNTNGGNIIISGGAKDGIGSDGYVILQTGSTEAARAYKGQLNATTIGIGAFVGSPPTITSGTGVPATTPSAGSLFLRTDGTSATGLYVYEAGAWTAISAGVSGVTWAADLAGSTNTSQTVVAIQNNAILSGILGASQDGYALTWVNSTSKWTPKAIPTTTSVTLAGDVTGASGSNTVVSLTGSAGVVTIPSGTVIKQLDGTGFFASSGTIRTAPTFSIVGRNTTNAIDINLLQLDGANNINIGSAAGVGSLGFLANQITAYTSGGAYIDALTVNLRGPSHLGGLVFDSSVANNIKQTIDAGYTFTLQQLINTSGAGLAMSFTGQAAKAASNANGGNIVISGGAKDGTGSDGYVILQTGSTEAARAYKGQLNTTTLGIGAFVGSPPTITSGTGVPATTPANGSIFLRTDGTSTTGLYIYEASAWTAVGGSTITFANDLSGSTTTNQYVVSISGTAGTGTSVNMGSSGNAFALTYVTGATSPTLKQADNTTNSATGQVLKIQAQNVTGTTATGGGLTLASGTGTTAAGTILLQTGSTTQLTLAPTLATFANPVSFSATVAASGTLRFPSATTIMASRNAANTSDLALITTDASDNIVFGSTSSVANASFVGRSGLTLQNSTTTITFVGATTTFNGAAALAIGATPAGTGTIRLTNASSIYSRNNANSADILIMQLTGATDQLSIGNTTGPTVITGATTAGVSLVTPGGTGTITMLVGGTTQYTGTFSLNTFANPVAIGTNPAAAGQLRISNATTISSRNAANSADLVIAQVDASNNVVVGDGTSTSGTGLLLKVANNTALAVRQQVGTTDVTRSTVDANALLFFSLVAGFKINTRNITASYTVDSASANDLWIDCVLAAASTLTLPKCTAGRVIMLSDIGVAGTSTFDVRNLTLAPNGTDKIEGTNANKVLSAPGGSWFIVGDSTGTNWKIF